MLLVEDEIKHRLWGKREEIEKRIYLDGRL